MAQERSGLRALPDADLIASVRTGSDAAFAVLYERHEQAARAAARSLGASRADTDDLVAEAFTRVFAAIRRGGGPEVAFRPYLMTSVRNAFYDRARKDGRVDLRDEVPDNVNLALLDAAGSSEDGRMIAQAFASLPERWQAVLWATEVEGRSPAEVGPALGLAPNAVAALAYRAREGLRQAFLQVHLQKLPAGDVHRDTVTKLGAYVRDGLSARDRRKVEEHLRECERCTALLLELQEVDTSLRGVLVPILLGVSATTYVAHLAAAAGGLAALLHWRPRSGPAKVAVAAGVAGSLLVAGLAIAAVSRGSGPSDRVAAGSPSSSTTATTSATAPSSTSPSTVPAPAVRATAPPPVATIPPQPSPPASLVPVTVVPLFPSPTTPFVPAPVVSVSTSTTTTTLPPMTTTTLPPTTTPPTTAPPTTAPPTTPPTTVPPPQLSLSVQAVGPAFAGVGASVQISVGSVGAAFALGQSLALRAAPSGPVTVTAAGAPVADWGVAGCPPGPSCQLPIGTTSIVARIELASAVPATVSVTFRVSAPGVRAATAVVTLQAAASPPGLAFAAVDHGGVAMAANTVIACAEPGAVDNNDCNTALIDVDDDASTFDSSSANLQLPAGATVLHAVLNWGGEPAGALDPRALGTVELTMPDGTTRTVKTTDVRKSSNAAYAATADVTALTSSTAASGTYTVADVQTGSIPNASGAHFNQFGGWSLAVAYRDPKAPRQFLALFGDPGKNANVLTRVDPSTAVELTLSGLTAPATPQPVRVGLTGYEGDRGVAGDNVTLNGVAIGAANNAFDSSIDVGPAPRQPNFDNQFGFDAHLATVQGAWPPPSGVDLTLKFATTDDTFYVGIALLAVPI